MPRRWEVLGLSFLTLIYMFAALASMGVAIMSPIAFNGPDSLWNPIAWLAFLLMISLWVVCILAPFAAWVMFSRQNSQMAWTLMIAPPIWACTMALLLFILQ